MSVHIASGSLASCFRTLRSLFEFIISYIVLNSSNARTH
uniref:Uncharacterized protein n=2 Tax=unclassified Caudoviricetes TaxID=2788787 RepID=A0A8S5N4A1_9CAUD|nr:MAG TPA: hypothetical protein [Siphoviridae sp. ctlSa24]DAE02674.1 MAG TPA: hypothetical protein [Siphoviridae sp. ct1C151]